MGRVSNTSRQEKAIIIISTFPSEESVFRLTKHVINNSLCACVNFTQVRSLYTWKGKIEDQHEWVALFKTTSSVAAQLKSEIAKLHPYEVPEIIEIQTKDVNRPYMSWLAGSVHSISKKGHYASKR
jgi:periplasmic divalent cation tolerance protein